MLSAVGDFWPLDATKSYTLLTKQDVTKNIGLTQHKRETHAVIEAWNTHGTPCACASASTVRVCMFQQHAVEVMET